MGKSRDLANLLSDGAIGASELADGAVSAAKFASGAAARSWRSQSFPITGNISSDTWYTLTTTGLFGNNGVALLSGYSNTQGYGGDHYDNYLSVGVFPVSSRTTNDGAVFNFPDPMYAGHAANIQRYYFRLRYLGGNPSSVLLEWQSSYTMSNLPSGALTFYIHELVGL